MKVIFSGRRSGKTTEIIRAAKGKNEYIVCFSERECHRVFEIAKQLKININFPITMRELLAHPSSQFAGQKLHIDNADLCLQSLTGIPVYTLSINDDNDN